MKTQCSGLRPTRLAFWNGQVIELVDVDVEGDPIDGTREWLSGPDEPAVDPDPILDAAGYVKVGDWSGGHDELEVISV